MRVAGIVVASSVAVAGGCGSSLPAPRYTDTPQSALVEVAAVPPPARVEMVPARPDPHAVWIDGEWLWRRARWAWPPGRWVVPVEGTAFSRWVFVRGADGRLWYASGEWRDASQAPIAAPRPLAIATVEGGAVVDADGKTVTTGPILHERPRSAREEEPDGGASPATSASASAPITPSPRAPE